MTTNRVSARRAAVLAIAAAAAIAGCGSSEEAGSGGGAEGEIVLGSVGPYSGTFSSTYGGVPEVIDAWVETVNAAGGIDGRRVRVLVEDIGSSTGTAATAVRQFIERDHVLAIAPSQDPGIAAWAPFAADRGVPVLSATTETNAYVDANDFNAQGSGFAVVYGMGEQAEQAGGRLGLAYCAEQPSCAQQSGLLQLFVRAQGVSVPVAAKVPAASADFTAYCQQYEDAGVDALFFSLSDELSERLANSCAEQGVAAKQLISGATTNLAWRSDPAYRDSVVLDPVAPFFDTSIPGVAAYRRALEQHAPELIGTEQDNSIALRAWASLQALAAAARRVDGPLTSESLKQGLYDLRGETLDGIVPPIAFTPGEPRMSQCYFRWSPFGTFRALDGGRPTCIPQDTIGPLVEPVIESLAR